MHKIYIGKRLYECPSKWEELSGGQMVGVAGVLHSPISENEALIRILLILMDVKNHFWLRFLLMYKLSSEARYDLVRAAKWVLYTENDCTDQKLPVIRSRGSWGIKLYGPLKECRRLVFMEFIEADTAYLAYRKNFNNQVKRTENLNRLVAVLYRDRNPESPPAFGTPLTPTPRLRCMQKGGQARARAWNGDPRCEYNPNIVDYQVRVIERMPDGYKYAILMFYHACHQQWEGEYKNIFKKVAKEDSDQGSSGGWGSALMSLAGGSLNIEKMMKVNNAAALRDLDNKIAEQERMESELKKNQVKK